MRSLLTLLLALPALASAQGTLADYRRADSLNQRLNPLIANQPTAPTWLGTGDTFWYRKSVTGGNEWLIVDAAAAAKRPLFDHARLATAVNGVTQGSYTAVTLPFASPASQFAVADNAGSITFNLSGGAYRCDIAAYTCARTGNSVQGTGGRGGRGGGGGGRGGGGRGNQEAPAPVRSHDQRMEAFILNHNIAVRAVGSDEHTILSFDGMEGDAYTHNSIRWAPDNKKLAAYRVRPGYRRMIPYIESSPDDQVQPKFSTRLYEKPGDPRDRQLPAVFNVETKQQFRLPESMIPHAYDLRRPTWRDDSRAFTFEYNERGHLRYQVQEINATTGAARVIIDEHNPGTYFSYYSTLWRQDVNDGREILWMSERDGWKHIWLYDGETGRVKNQVTKGEWVVRGVDSVDADKRQIWFRASGMYAGKDPYLIHYYRIGFDGSGLTEFTNEGDGNHAITWSPNREYYVDVWSRVDQPPVMELRRTSDQRRVMELERTDVAAANRAGWRLPEVFTAKARDGTTDIWGIILRPTNFNPNRKYPVIEYIYAGPHNHFVPKNFGLQTGMQALAELGFIVVQIDGMGTAQRSKAFHDVSWKDVGDAGFPDRILWHKAVAAKYPAWYDISRVGIYGTSAGGQNSTGALLFHPEFYHVAVSAVGCHDNRMDKISWNEQWMGYPIGPEYAASSNVDHAHNLQGKLLLVVGELDTNVDPQSTMQVVNALVRANKSHDLLFLPGQGHGSGGAFGTRMRNDYFVRHLLGVTPPDWNRLPTASADPDGAPGNWLEIPDEEAPGTHFIWR